MQVELLLFYEEIPDDLLPYFEPVDFSARQDIWQIATEPEKAAHFATFPSKLVEPCIKAGTSEKGCCPECRAPWVRVIKARGLKVNAQNNGKRKALHGPTYSRHKTKIDGGQSLVSQASRTIGWEPGCQCFEKHIGEDTFENPIKPVPCTVLDPFAGIGKAVIVAQALGRHWISIDLSLAYCEMHMDKLEKARKEIEKRSRQTKLFD